MNVHARRSAAALLPAALLLAVPSPLRSAPAAGCGDDPLVVQVLVLNYDPAVPSMGGQPLHQALGFGDPATLAAGYAADLLQASSGLVQYRIVQWVDLDEIPVKIDGYQYTPDEYVQLWQSGGGWHDPDTADYVDLIEAQGVPALIDSGRVDEVWLMGGPYFGFWEASMAGPGAFFINGGVYPQIDTDRPFAIMGFNYERGVAEMLHSLGHRVENSVARVFGGWNIANPKTDWDLFTANVGQSSAVPGVGNIHFPANGVQDYDYANFTAVDSTAEDWLNYPDLTGATTSVSAATWGGPDFHHSYMMYWYGHLPHAPGLHPATGRTNNWYVYVFDWTSYDSHGRPLCSPPVHYCVAGPNSTGQAATIDLAGSTSVQANDLVLWAGSCPSQQFGIFFFGPDEAQKPLGNGTLCIAGQLHRLPPVAIDVFGVALQPMDLTQPPAAGLLLPCTTWRFQFWYRDPASGTSTPYDLTDALALTFCP